MLKAGQIQTLKVEQLSKKGAVLTDGEENIILSNEETPKGTKVDDELEVFLYVGQEKRMIATLKKPYACAEEVAYLKVVSKTKFGAFVDWGLPKNLLIPFSEIDDPLFIGDYYPVFVYLDRATERMVASTNLAKFIKNRASDLIEGDQVDLMVVKDTTLGFRVVVNNRHWGMLFHSDVFQPVKLGDKLPGYIKQVREDFKLDVVLQQQGFRNALPPAQETIMKALDQTKDGFLPYYDKSPPEEIKKVFKMSKKLFKKAIGGLYKERLIVIEEKGIRRK